MCSRNNSDTSYTLRLYPTSLSAPFSPSLLIPIPHMYTDFNFPVVLPLSCPTPQSLPLSVQCLCNYVSNVTILFEVAAPFSEANGASNK